MQAPGRLYEGSMKALLYRRTRRWRSVDEGSIQALLRSIKALLFLLRSIQALLRLYFAAERGGRSGNS
jgi:hypothetical protein